MFSDDLPLIRSRLAPTLQLAASDFTVHEATLQSLVDSGLRLPESLQRAALKRRIEFLAGRHCARSALRLAGAADPGTLPISADKIPHWPEHYLGSISHASDKACQGGSAIAIVGRRAHWRGLGVDGEYWIAPERAPSIRPAIAELDELRPCTELGFSSAHALTLIFSLKEALYKCVNPQLGQYFDFLDAELIALTPNSATLRLRKRLSGSYPENKTFTLDYIALTAGVLCWCTEPVLVGLKTKKARL